MTETPLALVDADLRRLYEFWKERRGTRMAPARAEFDPLALRYVLGNLLLVDVLRDPLRFRYVLCGTIRSRNSGISRWGAIARLSSSPPRSMTCATRCSISGPGATRS
jgi:hypothetical protein